MRPVTVVYRGQRDQLVAHGSRRDGVVGFRWGYADGDRQREQLSFLLPDEGFLVAQPTAFRGEQRGWWYCDLVSVDDQGSIVSIEDLYVDVLVGPPGTAYRLLDLDELAAAVSTGDVPLHTAVTGLERCQRFLDRRLNRRHDAQPAWPDFPPAELETTDWHDLPRYWEWQSRGGPAS